MVDYIEYTAYDEMADCCKCDNVCVDFNCEKLCGPEHGWWGYRRTERIDSDYLDEIIKIVIG